MAPTVQWLQTSVDVIILEHNYDRASYKALFDAMSPPEAPVLRRLRLGGVTDKRCFVPQLVMLTQITSLTLSDEGAGIKHGSMMGKLAALSGLRELFLGNFGWAKSDPWHLKAASLPASMPYLTHLVLPDRGPDVKKGRLRIVQSGRLSAWHPERGMLYYELWPKEV